MSQNSSTSPVAISTTSTWSTRSGSASSAGRGRLAGHQQLVGRGWPSCERRGGGAQLAVAVEDPAARPRTAGTSSTPAAAASAVRPPAASAVAPSSTPLISAAGCSSHAAPASSTLSRSPRSRPPAYAWRNAASENATTRPICFAYVAASSAATRLSNGNGSGQRSGCSPYAARARLDRPRGRSSPPRRSGSRRPPRPASPSSRTGSHSGTSPQHVVDPLRGQVGLGRGEVVVEDRAGPLRSITLRRADYPWISQPSAARAASMTPSESVGWPWMMRATSG